jgi:N-acetylated-alpha-linked acidic dipeptidase
MDTDYPGDPLTPGVAATAEARRLSLKDAKTITRIPVLPIRPAQSRLCATRAKMLPR